MKTANLKFSRVRVPPRQTEPTIFERSLRWGSGMSPAMQKASPGLHPWESEHYKSSINDTYDYSPVSAPFAALGDFDGDGDIDVALHGRDGKRDLVFVLMAAGETYTFYEVEEAPLPYPDEWPLTPSLFKHGLFRFLKLIPWGNPLPPDGEVLDRDAFAVMDGSSSKIYYFSEGRFLRFPARGDREIETHQ